MTGIEFLAQYWGPILLALIPSVGGWIALILQFLKDQRERLASISKESLKLTIDEKDSTLTRAQKINQMYEDYATKFEQRVIDLEQDKLAKDKQIYDLNVLVSALEIKVSQRDNTISDQDRRIVDRDKRIVILENEVKELERKFRRNDKGIEKLLQQLTDNSIPPIWRPDDSD